MVHDILLASSDAGSNVRWKGATALAGALKVNTSVLVLDLSCVPWLFFYTMCTHNFAVVWAKRSRVFFLVLSLGFEDLGSLAHPVK